MIGLIDRLIFLRKLLGQELFFYGFCYIIGGIIIIASLIFIANKSAKSSIEEIIMGKILMTLMGLYIFFWGVFGIYFIIYKN